MSKKLIGSLALFMAFSASAHAATPVKGKVLVIVSSENRLQLQDGKTYPTGYYLNELTVPVRIVMENGYEVTFANPKGNTPSMDVHSDNVKYFGNDEAKYQDYKNFHDSLKGLKHPAKLSDVIANGLDQFDGVFIPGGHAPMVDLIQDPNVGQILRYFHENAKPTALICHGPISLIAALPSAPDFVAALTAGNLSVAQELAQDWIYTGYHMTIFSTAEEQYAEPNQLHGKVLFYPDVALKAAGGNMSIASPWQSNAVQDRELITGQNPYSDEQLGQLFLSSLNESQKN